MLALFEIVDSDKIPAKSKMKSDHNVSSPHDYGQNQSATGSNESLNASPSSANTSTNKDWVRSLASYTSMPPSSMGSSSNHIDFSNEIVDLISRCLQKCGEEMDYIPLFKVIFTTMNDVEENRYTRLLDERARDILLTGLITRIAQYVSKYVGLVFICDDVQCE